MTSLGEIIQATGVGASDIAAIAGISPWADAWSVYARKHGLIPPEEQTEEMFWGTMLQRVIADVFSQRTSLPIEFYDQRIYSKKRPWQYSSPDAFILDINSGRRTSVVECKTAGLHQSGEWDRDTTNENGFPEYYLAQLQWQLSTLEFQVGYIAVLIAGNDFRIYRVEHDPVLEEILLEIGEEFWREQILAKVEPPISGSERARHYLRKKFPREREKLRPATLEETQWLTQYGELRNLLDRGEARKKELENQITQAIGDAEGLEWGVGSKFTWKRIADASKTNWEKLARAQLAGYADDEQKALIDQYTETFEGYRRIHFREKAAR